MTFHVLVVLNESYAGSAVTLTRHISLFPKRYKLVSRVWVSAERWLKAIYNIHFNTGL